MLLEVEGSDKLDKNLNCLLATFESARTGCGGALRDCTSQTDQGRVGFVARPKTSFWRCNVPIRLTLYFLCDSELSYLIVNDNISL